MTALLVRAVRFDLAVPVREERRWESGLEMMRSEVLAFCVDDAEFGLSGSGAMFCVVAAVVDAELGADGADCCV